MQNSIFFVLIFWTLNLKAHEFHFGFSELQYNEIQQEFQASITLSTHDFLSALQQIGIQHNDLKTCFQVTQDSLKIIEYINQHYRLNINNTNLKSIFQGFEIQLNGTINLYLSFKQSDNWNILNVQFDMLMEEHEQQQNKLLFSYRNQQTNYIFTKQQIHHQIQLNL